MQCIVQPAEPQKHHACRATRSTMYSSLAQRTSSTVFCSGKAMLCGRGMAAVQWEVRIEWGPRGGTTVSLQSAV